MCACVDLEWNGGGWFFIKCVVDVPCAGSECVGRIFFSLFSLLFLRFRGLGTHLFYRMDA